MKKVYKIVNCISPTNSIICIILFMHYTAKVHTVHTPVQIQEYCTYSSTSYVVLRTGAVWWCTVLLCSTASTSTEYDSTRSPAAY